MELGLTFPLQRFLKQKTPPYGAQPDRSFCSRAFSEYMEIPP